LIGNTLLCIEVDENQHKRYSNKDEEIRYDDLFMIHGGKFIFIRFNPDEYINQNGTKVNPYMKKRMEYLYDEIVKQTNRILEDKNSELLEIVYLFYDSFN
jgi:very-short-patch-repair endonuclease